jgi:hypothetical protein
VIQNLASPLHAVGYAAGFAAGTAVGMWIEGKLALGVCSVRVFSTHSQDELVETLRSQGYGVTEQDGRGREGPVAILHAVVRTPRRPRRDQDRGTLRSGRLRHDPERRRGPPGMDDGKAALTWHLLQPSGNIWVKFNDRRMFRPQTMETTI